jgi:hypothetical protein
MHLLVVKTVELCYVVKIPVFVTGIVTHVMFLTTSVVLKGMLLEFVIVVRPPPSVNTVLTCLTSVLGVETDHWSTMTPVDKRECATYCNVASGYIYQLSYLHIYQLSYLHISIVQG